VVISLYCSSPCTLQQYGLQSAKTCRCINCIDMWNSRVKLKFVCNIETRHFSSRHAQRQILFYDILMRSLTNRCGQSRVSTIQLFSCCKQLNISNIFGRKNYWMMLLLLHLSIKLDCSTYIINLDITGDISTVFQSQFISCQQMWLNVLTILKELSHLNLMEWRYRTMHS
jgi:hypothetical protein